MLLLLISLLITGASAGSYVLTAPQSIQPGAPYDISVQIINATNVSVLATLRDYRYNGTFSRSDYIPLLQTSGTFGADATGKLTFNVAKNIYCERCDINIRGTGDLQFEETIPTSLSFQRAVIFIQTDKAIYKPLEKVRFRTFAVYYDLQMYDGNFNIEIRDPNNNKIKVLTNVSSVAGVAEDSFQLSDQPNFGTWTISTTLTDVIETFSQTFEVSQYELPRFEITVELPPFGLTTDDSLTGKVKAMYTFGQPVKGHAELHAGPNQGPNSCGDWPKTTQISFGIDGEASFSIPKEDIERAVSIYNRQQVKITVFVKEETTGVRLNGSSVITFYSDKYQIKYTDNTPNVFKPGLSYTAFIQATTPDGRPPTDNNITVSVYTSVNYQQTVPDQAFYDAYQFTGTYGLPGQNLTLPADGILPVHLDIPSNATSITIKTTLNDVQVTKTVEKMNSKSSNFIQLSSLTQDVKSGSIAQFKVDGTEPLGNIVYKVLSRGIVAASGTLDGHNQNSFTFDLQVTVEWAPFAHLLVYYPRGTAEIVADSLALAVDGIFHNNVSISFEQEESEPGKTVTLNINAEPNSTVFLLAVDQSVELLKTGNDVTHDKVKTSVSKFDKTETPKDSKFALSHSARTVEEVFSKTGLRVYTDLEISPPPVPVAMAAPMPMRYHRGPPGLAGYPGPPHGRLNTISYEYSSKQAPLEMVQEIRQLFPDVWMWSEANAGTNGTTSFSAVVPDTITSWKASAFATHPSAGLGVAPTTAKVKVFRDFFVSLTLPSTIVRGEQVVIQATIFNYLVNALDVVVTFKGSSKFQSVKREAGGLEVLESGDQIKNIHVESQKQVVAYFPILVSETGLIDIEVLAQSTMAADGIRRQITVLPEGVPVSFNNPIFVNLEKSDTFQDSIDLPLPDHVAGSDRARIKVTGNPIGASLGSLTNLIQLPTGCGEQSLVKFAPNVYIGKYLQSTGQMTQALFEKIINFLEEGYQRQLTYQRYDGGFSPFGNSDESSSTWLTAYVSRSLSEAREFIYMDDYVLVRSTDWMADRQNKDGSFNEFGKVLDSSTQGTGVGPSLTAFVLLAFLQNQHLAVKECTENFPCFRAYKWGNATVNAVRNLENLVDSGSIDDQFSMAVVSYALTLANSSKAEVLFQKLEAKAHREGGLLYWSDNSTVHTKGGAMFGTWQPPHIQSRPINILITSYAILTLIATNKVKEALPAIQWLTAQRNPSGGFASSQDTSVALQALSAYAAKSTRPDSHLTITISNGTITLAEFEIKKENALALQIIELDQVPQKAVVTVTGEGLALIEIVVSFNTMEQLTNPSFDVSTVLLDDDIDSFNVMVCTKYLLPSDSGMVVQVISNPSGFNPELDSLGNVAGLKRSERKGNTLNVYFDKIGKTSVCYSVRMTRTDMIARTQENFVLTRSYYNPEEQSIAFWVPKNLQRSNYCDVCDACCP